MDRNACRLTGQQTPHTIKAVRRGTRLYHCDCPYCRSRRRLVEDSLRLTREAAASRRD